MRIPGGDGAGLVQGPGNVHAEHQHLRPEEGSEESALPPNPHPTSHPTHQTHPHTRHAVWVQQLCLLGRMRLPRCCRQNAANVVRPCSRLSPSRVHRCDCVSSVSLSSSSPPPPQAALCAIRCFHKAPELIPDFLPRIANLLNDKSHSVLLCGLTLMIEVCKLDESLIPRFTRVRHTCPYQSGSWCGVGLRVGSWCGVVWCGVGWHGGPVAMHSVFTRDGSPLKLL